MMSGVDYVHYVNVAETITVDIKFAIRKPGLTSAYAMRLTIRSYIQIFKSLTLWHRHIPH